MKHRVVFFLIVLLAFAGVLHANEYTTVFLVRHAEKAKEPKGDPILTPEGEARAQSLVHILGSAGVEVIVSSQYARTRLTAEPLAKAKSLQIQERDAAKSEQLANEILTTWQGKTIFVSGHSDTLPVIIQALGGPRSLEIAESVYDNLFIVTIGSSSEPGFVHLKYGQPAPAK